MGTPVKLNRLLGILILSLCGCKTSLETVSQLSPKLYYLDEGMLTRNDNGEVTAISATAAKRHVCMHEDDLYEIYKACRLKSE